MHVHAIQAEGCYGTMERTGLLRVWCWEIPSNLSTKQNSSVLTQTEAREDAPWLSQRGSPAWASTKQASDTGMAFRPSSPPLPYFQGAPVSLPRRTDLLLSAIAPPTRLDARRRLLD